MTTATLNDLIIKVKFSDGTVVRLTESKKKFRVTTSSPGILCHADRVMAMRVLNKVGMPESYLADESFVQHMERFRTMAETCETILEFATKVKETVDGV